MSKLSLKNFEFLVAALLLPLAFFGSSVVSAGEPRYCTGYKNIRFVGLADYYEKNNGPESNKYSCSDFGQFDDLGEKINALVGFGNPRSNIIPVNKMADAKDDYLFDHMSIGFNRTSEQDLTAAKVVFVHEWSHSLLNLYFINHASLFEPVQKLRESLSIYQLYFQYINLTEEDGKCISKECLAFARDHADEMNKSSEANKELNSFYRNPMVELFLEETSHYQELFADFIAALYFRDAAVVKTALDYILKSEDIKPDTLCRSFNFSATNEFLSFDPHCSLSALRMVLWDKALLATTPEQKTKLVQKLLVIIERQAEIQYSRITGWSEEQRKSFPDIEAKSALMAEIQNL